MGYCHDLAPYFKLVDRAALNRAALMQVRAPPIRKPVPKMHAPQTIGAKLAGGISLT